MCTLSSFVIITATPVHLNLGFILFYAEMCLFDFDPLSCLSYVNLVVNLVLQKQLVLYLKCDLPVYTVTSLCSDAREIYAKKLTNFIEKRLMSERAASVSFNHMHNCNVYKFWFLL